MNHVGYFSEGRTRGPKRHAPYVKPDEIEDDDDDEDKDDQERTDRYTQREL